MHCDSLVTPETFFVAIVTKNPSSCSTTEYEKGKDTGIFILSVKFFGLALQIEITKKINVKITRFKLKPQYDWQEIPIW